MYSKFISVNNFNLYMYVCIQVYYYYYFLLMCLFIYLFTLTWEWSGGCGYVSLKTNKQKNPESLRPPPLQKKNKNKQTI